MKNLRLLLMILCSFYVHARMPNLLLGSIKFPNHVELVPIRVYHGGRIINVNSDQKTHELFFNIPRDNSQTINILIVDSMIPVPLRDRLGIATNTIDHFCVSKDHPYRFFQLTLVAHLPEDDTHVQEEKVRFAWQIQETTLDKELRIQDNTIIVLCNPALIGTLHRGNKFELPAIVLKEDETQAHIETILKQLLLTCPNIDTFHTKMVENIKQIGAKTLVIPAA